jgi:hypothetical protein
MIEPSFASGALGGKRHLRTSNFALRNDGASALDGLGCLADQIDEPVERGIVGAFPEPRQTNRP